MSGSEIENVPLLLYLTDFFFTVFGVEVLTILFSSLNNFAGKD